MDINVPLFNGGLSVYCNLILVEAILMARPYCICLLFLEPFLLLKRKKKRLKRHFFACLGYEKVSNFNRKFLLLSSWWSIIHNKFGLAAIFFPISSFKATRWNNSKSFANDQNKERKKIECFAFKNQRRELACRCMHSRINSHPIQGRRPPRGGFLRGLFPSDSEKKLEKWQVWNSI